MAIGQRIKYFRNRKGITQKQLGEKLGFLGKTSDVRMAQYESETRIPKQDLVKEMADILDINPHALTVPDIDSHIGFMHTLFALEDIYGLKVNVSRGKVSFMFDYSAFEPGSQMDIMIQAWGQQAVKLKNGEITRKEYDEWRYKYPELDAGVRWQELPSQELSDIFVKELKKDNSAMKRKNAN